MLLRTALARIARPQTIRTFHTTRNLREVGTDAASEFPQPRHRRTNAVAAAAMALMIGFAAYRNVGKEFENEETIKHAGRATGAGRGQGTIL